MSLFRRSLIVVFLLVLGCSAQSGSSAPANGSTDIDRRVERQIRAHFQIPEQVKIQVGARTASSDFPNYDKLAVTLSAGERKQDLEFLISKDNKTLVRWTKLDLTVDPYAQIMSKINLNGRPWKGNKEAKVVVVSYDDFQCPFCSRMHQTLFHEVFKDYAAKIKIVYKDFPLYQIHPWANHAAIDANCLAAQSNDSYWSFADYVHDNGQEISGTQSTPKKLSDQFATLDKIVRDQGQKFHLDANKLNACIKAQNDDAIRASVKEAEALGVQATPTLFINGYKIDGALPAQAIRSALDRALSDAGQQPPVHAASAAK